MTDPTPETLTADQAKELLHTAREIVEGNLPAAGFERLLSVALIRAVDDLKAQAADTIELATITESLRTTPDDDRPEPWLGGLRPDGSRRGGKG